MNEYLTRALRKKGVGPYQWWQGTLDIDLPGSKAQQQTLFEEIASWLNHIAVARPWFHYVLVADLAGCYRHSADIVDAPAKFPAWAGDPPGQA